MGWWTQPGTSDRTHSLTGARNMREHRRLKRDRAEARQAEEWARANRWRLVEPVPEAPAEVAPTKRKRKRKAKKNKGSVPLAAFEAVTEDWLANNGQGDF